MEHLTSYDTRTVTLCNDGMGLPALQFREHDLLMTYVNRHAVRFTGSYFYAAGRDYHLSVLYEHGVLNERMSAVVAHRHPLAMPPANRNNLLEWLAAYIERYEHLNLASIAGDRAAGYWHGAFVRLDCKLYQVCQRGGQCDLTDENTLIEDVPVAYFAPRVTLNLIGIHFNDTQIVSPHVVDGMWQCERGQGHSAAFVQANMQHNLNVKYVNSAYMPS